MNYRAIRTIVRKDLKVVLQSKAVMIPLIIVPFFILVLLPGIGGFALSTAREDSEGIADFRDESPAFFNNLPAGLRERLDDYDNEVQRVTYISFNMFFPPMYLLLPIMVANVIAADSFAGEKERKTLEALIHVPVTDREMYLAKLLGPWLAGIAVGFLGYIVFAVIVTLTTISFMDDIFVVDLTWLLFIFWVTPAASGMGLGAMVLVSSRVSTFQEAYQLGGMIVIPIILLLVGQMGGVIYFSPFVIMAVGAILWMITASLVWYGARTFERGALIARL